MTPPEIMKGMQSKNQMLAQKNDEYITLAQKRAEAEMNFNTAIAKCMLALKSEGQSVTLISTLSKGDAVVAELKFKYEVAHAVERACLESIKDIRGAIDTYRSLLAWLKAEMTSQT